MHSLENVCEFCRESFIEEHLRWWDNDPEEAYSKIYKMSRSLMVDHIMNGRTEFAKKCTNYEIMEVMDTIKNLIAMSLRIWDNQSVQKDYYSTERKVGTAMSTLQGNNLAP